MIGDLHGAEAILSQYLLTSQITDISSGFLVIHVLLLFIWLAHIVLNAAGKKLLRRLIVKNELLAFFRKNHDAFMHIIEQFGIGRVCGRNGRLNLRDVNNTRGEYEYCIESE